MDVKYLHGCSEGQIENLRRYQIPLLEVRRYYTDKLNVGKRSVFVCTVLSEDWYRARAAKYNRLPRLVG